MMELKDILSIALNVKRIKSLTDNEHIYVLVDEIIDIIQKNINKEMKKELINCGVGDYVYLDSYSSLGSSSTGKIKISEVDYKFDPDTGDKFKILREEEGDWYDSRDGGNYSNKNSMLYIEPTIQS